MEGIEGEFHILRFALEEINQQAPFSTKSLHLMMSFQIRKAVVGGVDLSRSELERYLVLREETQSRFLLESKDQPNLASKDLFWDSRVLIPKPP